MDIRTRQLEICRACPDYDTCRFVGLMMLLRELKDLRFNGSLHIHFKHGEPGNVRKEEVIDFIKKNVD
jgi:hypothetical protein